MKKIIKILVLGMVLPSALFAFGESPQTSEDTTVTANPVQTQPYVQKTSSEENCSQPNCVSCRKYVVKRGDYLYKISRTRYGTDQVWKRIYKLNKKHLRNPNHLYPGQSLQLP